MKRTVIGVAITAALALSFVANAGAANPPTGVFQGILNGSSFSRGCGSVHNEGEGYFRVSVTANGRRIVPVGSSGYCGGIVVSKILMPSDFKCNQLNANLTPSRIALSNGAFNYRGTEPIGPMGANRNVHVKGHWDTSTEQIRWLHSNHGRFVRQRQALLAHEEGRLIGDGAAVPGRFKARPRPSKPPGCGSSGQPSSSCRDPPPPGPAAPT